MQFIIKYFTGSVLCGVESLQNLSPDYYGSLNHYLQKYNLENGGKFITFESIQAFENVLQDDAYTSMNYLDL